MHSSAFKLLAALALASATLATAGAARGAEIGQPAPALVAEQLDGSAFDLEALRGSVVIVNFWATWCGPCRAEMPLLNRFYLAHRTQGLALIGVSVDDRDDRKEVAAVMRQFAYPALLAATAKSNGFGPPLAVPMTWVIDARGVVRARIVSTVSEQALEQAVLPLLPRSAASAVGRGRTGPAEGEQLGRRVY